MTGQRRTLQEWRTTVAPADVLAAAKEFFARNLSIYAAFIEQESPTHVSLRGQGGEEVIVAAHEREGATLVTGSSYIFDAQLSRFLSTLPPAPATVPALLAAEAAP